MKLRVRVRRSAETAVSPLTPGVFRPGAGTEAYRGRTTRAPRATATSLTFQPSPATVKLQAGTLARPRLVPTVTAPGCAPVTVSWPHAKGPPQGRCAARTANA